MGQFLCTYTIRSAVKRQQAKQRPLVVGPFYVDRIEINEINQLSRIPRKHWDDQDIKTGVGTGALR